MLHLACHQHGKRACSFVCVRDVVDSENEGGKGELVR